MLRHSWPSDDDQPNDVVVSDTNGVIFNVATGMCIVFLIALFVVYVYLLINTDISLVLLPKKTLCDRTGASRIRHRSGWIR